MKNGVEHDHTHSTPKSRAHKCTATHSAHDCLEQTHASLQQLYIVSREHTNLAIQLASPPSTLMLSGNTYLLSFAQRQFVLVLSGEVIQHNGVHTLLSARGWRGLVDVDGRGRVARTVGERVLLGAVAREGVLGRRSRRGTTEGTGRRLTRAGGGTTLLHLFIRLLGTTRTRTLARTRGGG